MIQELSFENGKYKLRYDTLTSALCAYRYGIPWGDYSGNKFMHSLFDEIYEHRNDDFTTVLRTLVNKINRDGGHTCDTLGLAAAVSYANAVIDLTFERTQAQRKKIAELEAEVSRLRVICSKNDDEISQTLGKALGYSWFKDDQKNFPGATEIEGVCIGEHVAASIAEEAANRIKSLESQVISVAYVEKVPTVKQGVPCHEVEEVLEASTVEAWLKQLEMLQSGNSSFYSDQIGKQ